MASDEEEASYAKNAEKQQVDEEKPAEDAADNGMDGELAAPSPTSSEKDDTDKYHQPAVPFFSRESLERGCWPQGVLMPQMIPLLLCFMALFLSGAGAWGCNFFEGAAISFTGGTYGIWTLKDTNGHCQLWDVLFFSYKLGTPLIAARGFTMAVHLIGLGLLTTMMQALQFYILSWGVGLIFVVLFLISVLTTSIFNIWIVFYLFTYVFYILIIRALFVHPVHRRISRRGTKIVASLFIICGVFCLLSLVVLKSDFCTCNNMGMAQLIDGRDPGDPCEGDCRLGPMGYLTMIASAFWFLTAAATFKLGVQDTLDHKDMHDSMYAHYPRSSITTRVVTRVAKAAKTIKKVALETNLSLGDKADASSVTSIFTAEDSKAVATGGDSTQPLPSVEDQDGEEPPDTRARCTKLCCDYRVTERTRKECWAFWSFRVMLGFLVGIYVFLVLILIGSYNENTTAAKAPDTTSAFTTEKVCGFYRFDRFQPFKTFATKAEADNMGYDVAHCGECGFCSNPEDIKVYVDTREVIAILAKKCTKEAVFHLLDIGEYEQIVECLTDRIGFTQDCTECWAENMMNTAKSCLFTCMVTTLTGFTKDNNVEGAGDEGWLNKCLYCDEKLSGPRFVECSGVARRRLGIDSAIGRNEDELCKAVNFDWTTVDLEAEWVNNDA